MPNSGDTLLKRKPVMILAAIAAVCFCIYCVLDFASMARNRHTQGLLSDMNAIMNASLRLSDGSECMVTQRCNWGPEPYTIAFYMRSPGGKWGWCYIDHQANRWRDVTMTYNTNSDVITVTKRGLWQAALDRKRSTFAIGDGKPKRELAPPQEYREPQFPFPR